jgi:hypothetical protein
MIFVFQLRQSDLEVKASKLLSATAHIPALNAAPRNVPDTISIRQSEGSGGGGKNCGQK